MFEKIFYTKGRVIFLYLFLLVFFEFSYLPIWFSVKNDRKLFPVLLVLLFLGGIEIYQKYIGIKFRRRINILFSLLFVFAIANCISCMYFRHQMPWTTFYHWSPIFLLYLFYPLSSLKFSVKSWEKVLFCLFLLEVAVEIIQNLFPSLLLFNMTSSNEKFINELRVRVYGNAILYIGCLFCLNKALVLKGVGKWNYLLLYILSFVLIILGGYRIVLFSIAVASMIMFFRIRRFTLKTCIIAIILALSVPVIMKLPFVSSRLVEIEERAETANLDNDDYVRIITLNYYLHDYFKSPTEMFLGSGLVKRTFKPNGYDLLRNDKYESNYSRNVSEMSIRYNIFPIDWGLLGFSWEAGIPAAFILILIAVMMVLTKTDEKYLYISAWGIAVLIFSITNGRYYSHHNLLFTNLLLVILEKVVLMQMLLKKKKQIEEN